jgi:hypothetical protein
MAALDDAPGRAPEWGARRAGRERTHLGQAAEPALVDTAIARVRLEGGVVKSVIIDWPPDDEGPTIGVFVVGTRKDGFVIADMSGNVIKVEVHD